MSYGDPNNPYGNPQGQPQQPGYGYPAAPPVQQSYAAAPMTTMPGKVNAARVMLWVIVALQVIGVGLFAFSAVAVNKAKNDNSVPGLADYPVGVLWAFMVLALAWLVWAIVLATKFSSGGNNLRVTTLVFGILTAVLGVYPFLVVVGIFHIVLGILIATFVGGADGKAWFNRARY
ncbi:hypothetical protein Shyhy01_57100 [Streptomyces hygroscopicus subsp. hygroscopicus]|uniref:hypothetical protein n=1 Tax=Streptomyces sp. KHY 26 TaxID=3097359 RepID=UPI0024A21A28|nr:hypothetical protein [Streptomyces hygroscopicus]GLX52760.1 hypothetical protein Shyhy01_57100 [Streptomyces hygroscopicus subsp. hygroscopicus]